MGLNILSNDGGLPEEAAIAALRIDGPGKLNISFDALAHDTTPAVVQKLNPEFRLG